MAGYPGTTNYTDLTSEFDYKDLLTWQLMDQLAENDDVAKDHMEAEGSGTSGATNPHGLNYVDVGAAASGSGGTPDDGSVTQAKLATASGEVGGSTSMFTLPGGTYGFYPQVKKAGAGTMAASIASGETTTSYLTRIYLLSESGGAAPWAQQRYVTASGRDHWIFLLVDKANKKVVGGYQAPDHPCYGTDMTEDELPHPFPSYDESKHEIILVDNEILKKLKPLVNRKKSLMSLITEDCIVDETKKPKYKEREIIEIDIYGDKPGKTLKKIKTPDWAKIKITQDEIILKQRMVKTIPAYIKYKALKLKG